MGRELAGAGQALFGLVRFWSRRWALRAAAEPTGEERRVQGVLVLEAVDSAGRDRAEVSVADVAHQLGIDQSGASRFVTAAISDGYIWRTASTVDRRRAVLAPTPAGRELLANSHAWQEQAFATLTAHWDRADAAQFAHYLRRFARELTEEPTDVAARR
jgi:DNA-binding MarR family transcriptional regulator